MCVFMSLSSAHGVQTMNTTRPIKVAIIYLTCELAKMSHPSFGLYELYNVCMLIEWCLCMWERWVFYPCESGMTPFWGPCRCQRGIVLARPNNSKQCTQWWYRVINFLFCLWKIYFFYWTETFGRVYRNCYHL